MPQSVHAIATFDTKGHELAFVAERLRSAGVSVVTVDVGTMNPPVIAPDVDRATVAGCHPSPDGKLQALGHGDRGTAIAAMSRALEAFLLGEHAAGRLSGVIGIGGSGGTALVTPAMQALPIGVPKLMVSTMANGNVAPYVGATDIMLMYSVVDVSGLNAVSRCVLENAALAMSGMVRREVRKGSAKPTLGMTMFGVTTPCVTAVREALEARDFDCLVFHATGAGGRAMEKLVDAGLIEGVLDITTTEVADFVAGGILACAPNRFEAMLRAKIPFVVSLGACDMVNFGAIDTVPERFRGRRLHVHNSQVTLMRTTPEENRQCARFIAAKLNQSEAPLEVLIPELGVSALDAPGMPFHDPAADAALFGALESALEPAPGRSIRRLPLHINDPAFARELVGAFFSLHSGCDRTPAAMMSK
jgi:uncharacterized protein (UPF0261 family)